MSYDFAFACYEEARFYTKHYQPDLYWRLKQVDPEWYELFNMGCEL